jgi:hypothetical protein
MENAGTKVLEKFWSELRESEDYHCLILKVLEESSKWQNWHPKP